MTDAYFWLEPQYSAFLSLNGYIDGVDLAEGVGGVQMPTIRRTHENVAGVAGSRLRSVAHDMRILIVPMWFIATSEEQLTDLRRLWRHRFDPARGDGQILLGTTDGRVLAITCRYVGGLEQPEDAQHRGPGWFQADLTFECDDPYWYDVDPTFKSWSLGGPIPFWFDPGTSKAILPIQLAASSVTGGQTIVNDGDVAAWPLWTISGPGAGVTVQNNTTGRRFTWNQSLGPADQLVIDTRPGRKTVELNGVNAFGALTRFDLWSLPTGPNDVAVTVADATVDSRVDLAFRRGWLGP